MSIARGFLAEFDPETRNTRRMLERIRDDLLNYRTHPKSMTLATLAGHIAEMPRWGTLAVQEADYDYQPPGGPAYEPFVPASRTELLEVFDRSVAEFRAAVEPTSDTEMRADWTLYAGGRKLFTKRRLDVLKEMVVSHVIHHRAQLGVYLRLNDVPVPGMYGPSADEAQAG